MDEEEPIEQDEQETDNEDGLGVVDETEKLNSQESEQKDGTAKNGGARPGAGRPKGRISEHVRARRIAEQEFRNRVIRSKDALMNAQMTLAQGVQMLYCITTDKKGNRSKPELVTDQSTIESYLAGELEDEENEYYFITTERPDNRALDSLFDRSFGKAKQPIELDADLRHANFNFDVPADEAELEAVKSAILGSVPPEPSEE